MAILVILIVFIKLGLSHMDQGVNSIPTLLFKLGISEEVECETRFFLDFNHPKDVQKAILRKVVLINFQVVIREWTILEIVDLIAAM